MDRLISSLVIVEIRIINNRRRGMLTTRKHSGGRSMLQILGIGRAERVEEG